MESKEPFIKFEDRYTTILTPSLQNDYIESLYDKFRVNTEVKINGKIEKATIIKPHETGEIERKKTFAKIETKRKQLAELYILQTELNTNRQPELNEIELNELITKYDNLFRLVFEIPIKEKKERIKALNRILDPPKETSNPYPRIFINQYAFKLFERLASKVKNPLADYSFIYRKMIFDKLIFEGVGDSEFREWLNEYNGVAIDKTKPLHLCKTHIKEDLYSITKEVIKQE